MGMRVDIMDGVKRMSLGAARFFPRFVCVVFGVSVANAAAHPDDCVNLAQRFISSMRSTMPQCHPPCLL